MTDGGTGGYFVMQFQLVSHGGGSYTLTRLDCKDAPTTLTDKGNDALIGADYTLNF